MHHRPIQIVLVLWVISFSREWEIEREGRGRESVCQKMLQREWVFNVWYQKTLTEDMVIDWQIYPWLWISFVFGVNLSLRLIHRGTFFSIFFTDTSGKRMRDLLYWRIFTYEYLLLRMSSKESINSLRLIQHKFCFNFFNKFNFLLWGGLLSY